MWAGILSGIALLAPSVNAGQIGVTAIGLYVECSDHTGPLE
jgi:F0F1-type ATP synthase membrane subunit c/vacuolar-type H+-ATPase subunit K